MFRVLTRHGHRVMAVARLLVPIVLSVLRPLLMSTIVTLLAPLVPVIVSVTFRFTLLPVVKNFPRLGPVRTTLAVVASVPRCL